MSFADLLGVILKHDNDDFDKGGDGEIGDKLLRYIGHYSWVVNFIAESMIYLFVEV